MAGKGNILSFDEVRNTSGRARPSASAPPNSKRRTSQKGEPARSSQKKPPKASTEKYASKSSSGATPRSPKAASSRGSASRSSASAMQRPAKQSSTRQTRATDSQAKKKPKAATGSFFPQDTGLTGRSAGRGSSARTAAGASGPIGSLQNKAGTSGSIPVRTKPGNSGRIGAPLPRAENSQGFGDAEQQREHTATISKFSEIRKKRTKNKAGKAFSRQFGETTSSAASSGPRAALYKGEMGSTHKKSARMQESAMAKANSGRFGFTFPRFSIKESPKRMVSLMVVMCLALSCMFLYPAAQQYYLAVRERDQLQAEYNALEQRNATIQSEVDYLSTEEGIEDRARQEFGWVKEDENAVTVYGLADSVETEKNYTKKVDPGSVSAPDTWYSPILDVLFGYKAQ